QQQHVRLAEVTDDQRPAAQQAQPDVEGQEGLAGELPEDRSGQRRLPAARWLAQAAAGDLDPGPGTLEGADDVDVARVAGIIGGDVAECRAQDWLLVVGDRTGDPGAAMTRWRRPARAQDECRELSAREPGIGQRCSAASGHSGCSPKHLNRRDTPCRPRPPAAGAARLALKDTHARRAWGPVWRGGAPGRHRWSMVQNPRAA